MNADIYRKLARHLDKLPSGFPPTEDGLELRILKRLFSPEQAKPAVHLNLIAESVPVIAKRARMSEVDTRQMLEEMAARGLIPILVSLENRCITWGINSLSAFGNFRSTD